MNALDLVRAAVRNSLRSKTRTLLTVLAIFIGAFTLTLTTSIGAGVNAYIDSTLSSIGASDVLTVSKTPPATADGPQKYNPDASVVSGGAGTGPGSVEAITSADLDALAAVPGVRSVEPVIQVQPDYIQFDGGDKYVAGVGSFVPGMSLTLAAGEEPVWDSTELQVAIPVAFVEPLGFASNDDAVGKTLDIGVTDATGVASVVKAHIVGVSEAGLIGGSSLTPNDALTRELHTVQSVGLTESAQNSFARATVRFDSSSTPDQVSALKASLKDSGYDATSVEDQIGTFKTIIDAIVLILNGFAIIALIASGFGIVNTLLMSVQERTREIGLMKAMGMSGGKVFGLFSLEAVFIGFLGSALGVIIGSLLGLVGNSVLGGGLLAEVPGLVLFGFAPASIAVIVVVVMGLAFLAGTIPAYRAARQDPIESLRYE